MRWKSIACINGKMVVSPSQIGVHLISRRSRRHINSSHNHFLRHHSFSVNLSEYPITLRTSPENLFYFKFTAEIKINSAIKTPSFKNARIGAISQQMLEIIVSAITILTPRKKYNHFSLVTMLKLQSQQSNIVLRRTGLVTMQF